MKGISPHNKEGYIYSITILIAFLYLLTDILLKVTPPTNSYRQIQNYQKLRQCINNGKVFAFNRCFTKSVENNERIQQEKLLLTNELSLNSHAENKPPVSIELYSQNNTISIYLEATSGGIRQGTLEISSMQGTETITVTQKDNNYISRRNIQKHNLLPTKLPIPKSTINSEPINGQSPKSWQLRKYCIKEMSRRLKNTEEKFPYFKLVTPKILYRLYDIPSNPKTPTEKWKKEIKRGVSQAIRNLKKYTD